MLLKNNYKILSVWKKPAVDDYENRKADYVFVKKFKGLIQYPMGQYYSKLLDIYDKETLRMSGILFAPKSIKFDDKNLLRNVDGNLFAFFSIIPINQNIGMIKGVRNVDHNEYRIEFINKNIKLPIDKKPIQKYNYMGVYTENGLSLVSHDDGKIVALDKIDKDN